MNKTDLEKLTQIRLAEAKILLSSGHYHGAYYLTGYVIECALKACVAKQVQQYDFPNKQLANASHSHRLSELLNVAGLKPDLLQKEQEDIDFSFNWTIIKDWSETSRYESHIEQAQAVDMFNAVADEKSGVLAWLKTYW